MAFSIVAALFHVAAQVHVYDKVHGQQGQQAQLQAVDRRHSPRGHREGLDPLAGQDPECQVKNLEAVAGDGAGPGQQVQENPQGQVGGKED